MPRKHIWSGLALAAAAVASLSGCSLSASDGTPQSFAQLSALSPQDAVKAATRAVAAHPSAKVHTVLSAQNASETVDVAATFGEHPVLQGTLKIGGADPAAAGGSPALPVRYAHNVMYLKADADPTVAAELGGKAWLRMDLEAMAKNPRTASIGTDVLENTSPAKGLTLLAAAKDLHKLGEEQRGGVQTVHYTGTVTAADAADPNLVGRGLTQEAADGVDAALAHGAVSTLVCDFWLRADGLPVSELFSETTPVGTLTGQIDYTDWGTDVAVDPISADQSVDYMALLGKSADGDSSSGSSEGTPDAPESSSAPSAPSSSSAPSTPSPSGTPSAPKTPATPSTPQATSSSS